MSEIKTIAVLTSGGDAPGMNACIRAVIRSGRFHGLTMFGVKRGYEGLIEGDLVEMRSASVSNIIQRGGTILKTARSEKFKTVEGRKEAYNQLQKFGIDALIVIGGDGTFSGALQFGKEFNFPIVGIPGTIDNDLFGTDFTLGFDTATNTALDAIDRIRDTADSHNRLFFIEVMGRDAGFIALESGIAGGAEAILVPETETDLSTLIAILEKGWKRKKSSMIVVVAEGDEEGGAFELAKKVKEKFDHFDIRVSVLGHIQRGGKPSRLDRVLGSKLGLAAIDALQQGKKDVMIGLINNQLVFTHFSKAIKHHQDVDPLMLQLVEILSN